MKNNKAKRAYLTDGLRVKNGLLQEFPSVKDPTNGKFQESCFTLMIICYCDY